METAIGIDLGTTFSAIATVGEDGKPVTLKDMQGETLTPSIIWFGSEQPVVGAEAKEMQAIGEESVAAFFKRNMGDPNFSLHFNGKDYSAQDLSSIVLKTLKEAAEFALGKAVHKAVITVPAYFNNFQREATIAAGKAAGLEVLRIINEPTAAAIAFGITQKPAGQTLLVYDLGGGTFDVTIIRITPENIEVIGTDGDHELGGKNWDDRIVNWVARQFEEEFGEDPLSDNLTFHELLVRAENAKKQLSIRNTTRLAITHGGEKGRYDLDVDTFEDLTKDLLERTQMLTEGALQDVGLSWEDLDGVLLVGGSTRMPMVANWLEEMSGKKPLKGINVDEAVALGAAIQANIDANPDEEEMLTLGAYRKIQDVMSHSLGLVAENEDRTKYINSIIIPKNLAIPSTETRPFQVRTRNGSNNELEAYMLQGESESPLDCQIIGKYVFSGIDHERDTLAVVDVTYAYDQNGVINITGRQRKTGKELPLEVQPVPDDMSWLGLPPKEEEFIPAHLSLLVAIDLSGSMTGKPLNKSKEAAKKFVRELDLSNASIGLVVFSDQVKMSQDLCQNAKTLFKGIDGWTIGSVGYGNSGQPFTMAKKMLESRKDPKYLVVLTDGVWYDQPKAIREAEACKATGMEIVAVGFGAADKAFLKKIATSDENALLTSLSDLTASFSKIAQVLTDNGGLRVQGEKPGKSRGLRIFG